jgi:acyl-homoserine-lactone acylase
VGRLNPLLTVLTMKRSLLLLLTATAVMAPSRPIAPELSRWEQQARNVTITRDDWGIAHIHGKTDADAVFGMIYAQAEDDFNRVETNFINSQGRLAEAEGEAEVWRDLRMKLFINPDSMKAKYAASPEWLKTLMVAWADGLNFYMAKHPEAKARVITKFEPWMALTFSEGSIGGDIEKVNLAQLAATYGGSSAAPVPPSEIGEGEYVEPTGSNGIAIAPSNTTNKRALLLINPHTSFFFRSELKMESDEGLNAYGAVTWGQFFIYQGFNDRAGWMHTTSSVDDTDEYLETLTEKDGKWFYKYGNGERPVTVEKIVVPYKTATGMARKEFSVLRTHHGPLVRKQDGKWVAMRIMQEPVKALTQSYTRTKSRNFADFRKSMELHTNSSNNTIYADADGTIAYFHANFVPKRDPKFDWRRPVDGSDPTTEWGPLHSVEESPFLKNPASGWLYNTNNSPWTAAGTSSPKQGNYPAYMDVGSENARGLHAVRVLSGRKDFSIENLRAAAYDSYLPAFAAMVPGLLKAYDAASATDPLKGKLKEQIDVLRKWDYRWVSNSVATSLAVYWGEALGRLVAADARGAGGADDFMMAGKSDPAKRLQALASASDKLAADFGKWATPWGEINRFQRLTADIVHPFNDGGASIPVAFTSARWGSLASFGARAYPQTKKWYGTSGNSFVSVVEFGDSVRARAVSAGGESGQVGNKHFIDQAERYATGNLRDVYFYASQLKGHTERAAYHPGE